MAKKKKKKFQKKQLLSLFHNENYQKVISKIKQFEIDGMSDKELYQIQITSYEKLANANFELGDINRAMRDIESLLTIDSSEEYKIIKLKYLCYMEYFKDAIIFAQDLINSKNSKIKKEALFLYILANIYSGNYDIEEKSLKLLPIARVNYILGFKEFLKGNIEEALLYLDKCNPRVKIEKKNIEAIKYIILNQETTSSEILKPLYRFLINGDDTNLQNTKNSRIIKKDISTQFYKNKKSSEIEKLISLKSSIPIETIVKEIKDREKQTKLIYNNIVLLVDKQKNYHKALELFIKNKNQLVQIVESAVLFIQIKLLLDDTKSDKIVVSFLSNYLKLHYKKLSPFQLDFIFVFLIQSSQIDTSIRIIKEYNGEDIIFILKDLIEITEVEPSTQERFNRIIKRYSFIKDKAFEAILGAIDSFNENISIIKSKEIELFAKQLSKILTLFQNCQKPHKKYQPKIFKILSSMSSFIQNLDFATNRDLYIQLSETINRFIEIFNMDRGDLSKDIKTLFTSIEKKKSIKKEKKTDDKTMFDMFKRIVNDYDEDDFDDMLNSFDEDYLDDNDLARIKKDFIEALKNNQTPFNNELEDIEDSFNNPIIFEFILDLVGKAIEFDRYDDSFTQTLLDNMYIEPEDSYYREDLIMAIKKYAKKDIKIAIIFLYDCITLVPTNQRETVWYLKWLEAYLYLVDDYAQPRDKAFKGCLNHFIKVQQKKRFKTLNDKFKKLINRFKDKGLF
jgi:hypothetical protein